MISKLWWLILVILLAELRYFGEIKRPRIRARVKVGDRYVQILFVHPIIPGRRYETRVGEFAQFTKEAAESLEPVILAGDLNSTPWSHLFEALKSDGHLIDSEQGLGPQMSWHTVMALQLFPIDHCLHSPSLYTIERRLGPRIGSDHLPVITKIGVPEP